MTGKPFAPEVVQAICRHMNDDHRADSLLICRTLGGAPDAVEATAVDVDGAAMRFQVARADGTVESAEVPFASPALERSHVRLAVVELYERACAAAGIVPRSH
jgi:predicted RNA polymerase sigma factor